MMGKWKSVLVVALWVAGCTATTDPGRDTGESCDGSGSRCMANSFQVCGGGGTFIEEQVCASTSTCNVISGCVACNPTQDFTCSENRVVECNDGSLGGVVEVCASDNPCQSGRCGGSIDSSACAAGAELVYLVDTDNNLLSFDPSQFSAGNSPFATVGRLACSAGNDSSGARATPFSMSVDRHGVAWVLYSNGQLFHVSTVDASCSSTSYAPGQLGFQVFGMGFASDGQNSQEESLYIAGTASGQGDGELGRLDTDSLSVSRVGSYPSGEYGPELTGTGDGKLYGYFPGSFSSFISELDKSNGSGGAEWQLEPPGQVTAWAFAQWGGKFYIFISVFDGFDSTPTVIEYDPAGSSQSTVVRESPFNVVGAGVSTCAPFSVE